MRFRKKYRRWLVLFFGFFIILFLLALALKQGAFLIDRLLLIESHPAVSLNSDQPVQADLLFNDEAGAELFSERIIREIGQAQKSVELAMYAFSSTKLREVIYAAARRGLSITLITDVRKKENLDIFLQASPANIIRLEAGTGKGSNGALMHHKFALIDRGEPTQKLIFGSYNWTDLQEKYDPSFLMISSSSELVASFGREFNRLKTGKTGPKKFTDESYQAWDLSLKAADRNYEVWFGPGREGVNLKKRLLDLINGAQQDLKIIIWDFTDQDLAVALIKRARAGVRVTILTDTWNFYNRNSAFLYLQEAKQRYQLDNFELITDYLGGERTKQAVADSDLDISFDPFLHHHFLIVDDRQIFFGTNNWSRAGAYFNDESAIISDDLDLITRFQQVFARQYERNIKTEEE